MSVRITNIQHFSLHDGSGIRTTVFLKGCNLNCPWCCNPENIDFSIEKYSHDLQIEEFGYDISLKELEEEILKDEIYFGAEGGVTFSGGEPLLQIKELKPLLKSLKSKNINICFETALFVNEELLKIAIDFIDELFIDIKILDGNEARDVLNGDIDLYYENLKLIDNSKINKDKITFRIPLNNEYTLKEANVKNILDLIIEYPDYNVEIFKVHNLAESKYDSLNIDMPEFSNVSDEDVSSFYERIKQFNPKVKVIQI